jgi:hypothetical protein
MEGRGAVTCGGCRGGSPLPAAELEPWIRAASVRPHRSPHGRSTFKSRRRLLSMTSTSVRHIAQDSLQVGNRGRPYAVVRLALECGAAAFPQLPFDRGLPPGLAAPPTWHSED